MIEPIGDIVAARITPAAPISGDHMPSTAGRGALQLGPILSTLAQEFGSYSSSDQLAVLLASIRLVAGAGVPAMDLADSMYSNSVVLGALRDGNPEVAKQAVLLQASDAISYLRGSGVPEASLHALSTAGFAVAEIAYALRTVPGLRDELLQGDTSQLRQMTSALHELFRDNGRSIHSDPTMLAALGEKLILGLDGAQGSYFERYMNRLGAAQIRSLDEVRAEDHPELMLFSGQALAPGEENSQNLGGWMIAVVVGAAMLLIIASRC